jgi:hypothetical protein
VSLKVTWEGNDTGASIPLPVIGAATVTVVVLDDTGAPHATPHEVLATVLHTNAPSVDFKDLPVVGGTGAQGIVRIPQRWYWPLPRLHVSARRADGGGTTERRILIVPGPMLGPVRVAQIVGALGFLYLIVLFPQLNAVSALLANAPWAIALFVVAARGLRVRVFGHLTNPSIAFVAMLAVLMFSLYLHSRAKMIVNASVEKIATFSGEVAPGDYVIAPDWNDEEWKKKAALGFCRGAVAGSGCVPFDVTSSFWSRIVSHFHFVGVVTIGCNSLPLLARRSEFWKAQKRCLPIDPPPPALEHLAPAEVFGPVASLGSGDEVTVDFGPNPDADAFAPRKEADYQVLSFGEAGALAGSGMASQEDLKLRMTGVHGVREITATLGGGDVLTPAEGAGHGVLPATLLSSALVVGDLMVTVVGKKTLCDMATTDQRLAALVLRRGDDVYRFVAEAPDFVRHFPVCWPEKDRPDYGEIRLDAAWTPLAAWSLTLAARDVPKTLAVLDSAGKAVGQLDCSETHGMPENTADGGKHRRNDWSIGPLRVDDAGTAFAAVALDATGPAEWRVANSRGTVPWIWMCWQGTPPAIFGANDVHAAFVESIHAYEITRVLRVCRYYQNGAEVPATDECALPFDPVVAELWYKKYGPGDCAPRHKTLCPWPPARSGPDGGAGPPLGSSR